jgi:hypothetical protein
MNINITEKFPKKNFLKKGVPLYHLKKFPRKILRKGSSPLYGLRQGGYVRGVTGGGGTEGVLPYINGGGVYIGIKKVPCNLRHF